MKPLSTWIINFFGIQETEYRIQNDYFIIIMCNEIYWLYNSIILNMLNQLLTYLLLLFFLNSVS